MDHGLLPFFGQASISFLLLLAFLALFSLRRPLSVAASTLVRCSPDRLFSIVDFAPGEQGWHRGKAVISTVDEGRRIYRVEYTTLTPSGVAHMSQAFFMVVERRPPELLVAERYGLDGSLANQLLRFTAKISAHTEGSRITLRYDWGPRNLIAQILARTEIRASLGRIKSFAETGKADNRTELRLSLGVAAATGALSLIGFGLWLDWISALLLIFVIAVHELGHLIAFRLLGQPWGRLIFIPFLGALAMPRVPFRSQWEHALAALLGPGMSIILLVPLLWSGAVNSPMLSHLVWIAALINGLNLLPVLPLDGGHVMQAILRSLLPSHVRFAMIGLAALLAASGVLIHQPVLFAVALLALFATGRDGGEQIQRLKPMSASAAFIVLAAYASLAVAYGLALWR